jgi:hypothetical protein
MESNFKAQFPINKMLRIKLKNKPYLKKIWLEFTWVRASNLQSSCDTRITSYNTNWIKLQKSILKTIQYWNVKLKKNQFKKKQLK